MMSDESTSNSMGNSSSADNIGRIETALRDVRWLSVVIWAGMLAALLVTSTYGIEAFTQGSIATRYFLLPTNPGSTGSTHAIAIAGLIASALAAVAIAVAWWQFAQATRSLIIAYGAEDGDIEAPPIAAEWIGEPPEGAPDGTKARVAVVEVMLWVGAAWAVLILTPAFLNIVSSYATTTTGGVFS